MERYHIYKLDLAILFYIIYCSIQGLTNGLKVENVTENSNTTDYRERRDSGDDGAEGTPGIDFPTLSHVPKTKFSCRNMEAGYYADLDTDCQVFHICDEGRKLSFLCPNGTIFRQADLICDWWFKVNCTTSPLLYEESAEVLQRENAKRKEQRRLYQGTKHGTFSNNEDYDYTSRSHKTPSHFVTPSYSVKSTLKTIENQISKSPDRRNFNLRTDQRLDSFGNGIKENKPKGEVQRHFDSFKQPQRQKEDKFLNFNASFNNTTKTISDTTEQVPINKPVHASFNYYNKNNSRRGQIKFNTEKPPQSNQNTLTNFHSNQSLFVKLESKPNANALHKPIDRIAFEKAFELKNRSDFSHNTKYYQEETMSSTQIQNQTLTFTTSKPLRVALDQALINGNRFGISTPTKVDGRIDFSVNGTKLADTQKNISAKFTENLTLTTRNENHQFSTNFPEKINNKLNNYGSSTKSYHIKAENPVVISRTSLGNGKEKIKFSINSYGLYNISSVTEQSIASTQRREYITNPISAETQELQETASFAKNNHNYLQSTTKMYPNHREIYSEIKDPRQYYEKPYNKLPQKPFYGSSTNPQVLSTVPVTFQVNKVTTEGNSVNYRNFRKESSTEKLIEGTTRPYSSISTSGNTYIPKTTLQVKGKIGFTPYNPNEYIGDVDLNLNSVSSTLQPEHQNKEMFNIYTTPYFSNKIEKLNQESTTPSFAKHSDSPVVKLNIISSTLLPYNNKTDSRQLYVIKTTPKDSPFVHIFSSRATASPNPLAISTSQLLPSLGTITHSNINDNYYQHFLKVTKAIPSTPSPFMVKSNTKATSLSQSNTGTFSTNFEKAVTNTIHPQVKSDYTITTIAPTTIEIPKDEKLHSTLTTKKCGFEATTQTISISETTTPIVLHTPFSTILQPKPFSNPRQLSLPIQDSISPSLIPPVYPAYQLSSASPFATSKIDNNEISQKPLNPTLPTPFSAFANQYPTDENLNNMINTLMEVVKEKYGSDSSEDDFSTSRPGLLVPPSAGPKSLHSLAVYFANALTNSTEQISDSEEDLKTNSASTYVQNEKFIKSLLTHMTSTNYDNLFKEKDITTTTETGFSIRSGINEKESDLLRADSKHPAEGPEVRHLARVFTEALSAYLEDPDTFKKVLYTVRPTEPPNIKETVTEKDEDEVLNYSDSDLKYDHPRLLTRPTTLPVNPTWGFILAPNDTDASFESRNSISGDTENLQSADSQSFVSHFNNFAHDFKIPYTTTTPDFNETNEGNIGATTVLPFSEGDVDNDLKNLPKNHWTTSSDVAKLWQTTLSVNPVALNENLESAEEEDVDTSSTQYYGTTSAEENSQTIKPHDIQYELRSLPKIDLNSTQVHGILIDFMSANKTDGSLRLQRILQKLNITQEEFLMKMKEIEGNPLTRRLILLLISECSSDRQKQLETRSVTGESKFEHITEGSGLHLGAHVKVTESNIFKRIVNPDLNEDDEDTRALELLNSLYVIASKFGK